MAKDKTGQIESEATESEAVDSEIVESAEQGEQAEQEARESEAPDLGEALRAAYDSDHEDVTSEAKKKPAEQDDAAADAEEKADDATPQSEDAQSLDEFSDDELGKMQERTRERVQTITTRLKDTTAELETVRGDYAALADTLRQTGANAEQLDTIFKITAGLTSGDPERGRVAVEHLYRLAQDYARTYGAELPEFNMLANHQDLQDKVDMGEMTREMAVELAKERNRLQGQQQFQQREREQREQLQAATVEANQVAQEIQTLHTAWAKQDPDWRQKQEHMSKLATEIAGQYQSGMIDGREAVDRLKSGYNLISDTFNSITRKTQRRDREPNSLRPGGSSGQGKVARGGDTLNEALRNAYDSMPGS